MPGVGAGGGDQAVALPLIDHKAEGVVLGVGLGLLEHLESEFGGEVVEEGLVAGPAAGVADGDVHFQQLRSEELGLVLEGIFGDEDRKVEGIFRFSER